MYDPNPPPKVYNNHSKYARNGIHVSLVLRTSCSVLPPITPQQGAGSDLQRLSSLNMPIYNELVRNVDQVPGPVAEGDCGCETTKKLSGPIVVPIVMRYRTAYPTHGVARPKAK